MNDIISTVKQNCGIIPSIMTLFVPQNRSFPTASRILRPGERALPPNVERYPIAGGGSLVSDMKAGDKFVLTDLEGGQGVELAFCDSKGRNDLAAISA